MDILIRMALWCFGYLTGIVVLLFERFKTLKIASCLSILAIPIYILSMASQSLYDKIDYSLRDYEVKMHTHNPNFPPKAWPYLIYDKVTYGYKLKTETALNLVHSMKFTDRHIFVNNTGEVYSMRYPDMEILSNLEHLVTTNKIAIWELK